MSFPDYEEQLNELFEDQEEVRQAKQTEGWSINDLSTALWADGIIHEKEEQIKEIERVYEERKSKLLAKLDEWKAEATKPLLNDIEFFKSHLHIWHMKLLEEDKQNNVKKPRKTIKLQYRDLTCRAQSPKVLINGKEPDKAKTDPIFLEFVKTSHPKFIKEEVAWGDFKKTLKEKEIDGRLYYVDENGEPIDFIELIPQGDKFDWKLK